MIRGLGVRVKRLRIARPQVIALGLLDREGAALRPVSGLTTVRLDLMSVHREGDQMPDAGPRIGRGRCGGRSRDDDPEYEDRRAGRR